MHEGTGTAPRRSRLDRLAEERASSDPGRVPGEWLWALVRVAIGFVFLWAFLDKLLGLGRATPRERSWLNGGSPTKGFLGGVEGPFQDLFAKMAGRTWADWLFMIGLGAIGLALMLGIGMIIAGITGPLLLVMMWMASLPITTNPFLDDHLIYALVIVALAVSRVGERYGLGGWWSHTGLVRALPVLR